MCLPQNRHFSWWEWDTKEGTGKSMKNALHVQRYGKRNLLGWSNIKQWKNQAHSLSHCWATRVWRHQTGRQAGRQLISRKFCLINFSKSCSNFLKAFRVNLKAWFYLTNTAPSSSRKIVTDFMWIYFMVHPYSLLRPYYEPQLWFMINQGLTAHVKC